jgi:hypothetical protein
MEKQLGASTTPAFPAKAEEEVNVGIVEEDTLNESIEKLQHACQKTMSAVGAAASVVQKEVTRWTASVGEWSKQEVRGAEIASQTYSQIGEGLVQVEQTIARVKNRSQFLPTDIISMT